MLHSPVMLVCATAASVWLASCATGQQDAAEATFRAIVAAINQGSASGVVDGRVASSGVRLELPDIPPSTYNEHKARQFVAQWLGAGGSGGWSAADRSRGGSESSATFVVPRKGHAGQLTVVLTRHQSKWYLTKLKAT